MPKQAKQHLQPVAGKGSAASSSSSTQKKRARPAEPAVDFSLAGTRCIALEGVDGAPVSAFVKPADADGKQVVIIAHKDDALLAALESLDNCTVSWSSRSDGDENAGADGMQWALLTFSSAKAARKFLRSAPPTGVADEDDEASGSGSSSGPGLQSWLSNHTAAASMDARQLQAWADGYMSSFDDLEAGVSQAKTELEAKMEADGFTLVSKKGAKGHAAIPAAAVAAGASAGALAAGGSITAAGLGLDTSSSSRGLSDNQKKKLKRGSLVHEDFYKFQAMGAKLDALADLRAKFAEDRERIARLKEGRVFKPF